MKSSAIIALGSNMKIPLCDLKKIPYLLIENMNEDTTLEAVSSYFQTPCVPKGAGPDYINAVFSIKTNLPPQSLLEVLHQTEEKFGRERPYRWASRTLDLDLIFYENLILPNRESWEKWAALDLEQAQTQTPDALILPHPRAHERSFVLGPANEIIPDFIHPALNLSVRELWKNLPKNDRLSLSLV